MYKKDWLIFLVAVPNSTDFLRLLNYPQFKEYDARITLFLSESPWVELLCRLRTLSILNCKAQPSCKCLKSLSHTRWQQHHLSSQPKEAFGNPHDNSCLMCIFKRFPLYCDKFSRAVPLASCLSDLDIPLL
jgi:hypothetical protein